MTGVCPNRDRLSSHLLGEIQGDQAEELDRHLETCPSCLGVLRELTPHDDLTDHLRNSGPRDGEASEIDSLIESGKRLQCQVETVETNATVVDSASGKAEQSGVREQATAVDLSFLRPPEQTDEIGRLGGYRVLELLGTGGMGVVLRAQDPGLERDVALKVMNPGMASVQSARERFLREARATAAIEHDNIVPIYQVGEDNGVPFIAMRLLQGYSLQREASERQPMDARDVAEIGRQIATGLAAAHDRGLIHRDIKPDNIWIEADSGRVRILDFGLARTHQADAGLTQTGVVLGTPKYMAPEQSEGDPVDHRSDLFSLGAVLYQLAAGKPPFGGQNLVATLLAVSQVDCQPIDAACPQLDDELTNLITRLLSKSPADRPQTTAEVADALSEITSRLDAERSEQERRHMLAETAALDKHTTANATGQPAQPVAAGADRPRSNVWITSAALLAVLCGGAWLLHAFGVFKVQTPDGTLVVKVNSPDFETIAQGKIIKVRNIGTGATYTIELDAAENDQPLQPGAYEFAVTNDDGFRARVNRFEIGRGERKEVEVWWEPTADVAAAPAGQRIRGDRSFFTALLHLGMQVSFTSTEAHESDLVRNNVAGMDPGLPWEGLTMSNPRLLNDSPHWMNKHFNLGVAAPEEFGDEHLRRLGRILASRAPDAEGVNLKLYHTSISSAGLSALEGLSLHGFETNGFPLTRAAIESVRKAHVKYHLVLDNNGLDDAGLETLMRDSPVTWLHVPNNRITGRGLKCLAGSQVAVLNIAGNELHDKDLAALEAIPRLSSLYLSENPISDAGLARLPSIAELSLRGTEVTPEAIERFGHTHPNCRITWDGGTIEPQLIGDREFFTSLLDVGMTVVLNSPQAQDSEFLREDVGLNVTNPQRLDNSPHWMNTRLRLAVADPREEFGDEQLQRLARILASRAPNAEGISLQLYHTSITSAGLQALDGLSLLTFETNGFPLTREAVDWIRQTNVRAQHLVLSDNDLDDAGLETLVRDSTIHWLHVPYNHITRRGLQCLVGSKVTILNIAGNDLHDDDLAALESMPHLTGLYLSENPVTDACLARLERLPSLQHLFLQSTEVTPEAIERFSKSQTNCRITWDGGTIEPQLTSDREFFTAIQRLGGEVAFADAGDIMSSEVEAAAELTAGNQYRLVDPAELGDQPHLMQWSLLYLTFAGADFDDQKLAELAGVLRRRPEGGAPWQVRLRSTSITEEGLSELATVEFAGLTIESTHLSEAALGHIQTANPAQALLLNQVGLDDAGLEILLENRRWGWFHIPNNQVTGDGLKQLIGSGITVLHIAGNELTDDDLLFLGQLPTLTALYLADNPLTDEALESVAACRQLTLLDLSRVGVTAEAVQRLHEQLPKCRIVWDGGTIEPQLTSDREYFTAIQRLDGEVSFYEAGDIMTPEVTAASEQVSGNSYRLVNPEKLTDQPHLARWALTYLNFAGPDFTDTRLAELAMLLRRRPADFPLCELRLNATAITGEGLSAIANLKLNGLTITDTPLSKDALRDVRSTDPTQLLTLSNVGLDDDGLELLLENRRYFWFHIPDNRVTGNGLKRLVGSGITVVNIAGNGLTDEDVTFLQDMPELTALYLADNRLTDRALDFVRNCTELTFLNVTRLELNPEAVQRLHEKLPKCQILWDGGTIEPQLTSDRE